MSYPIPFICSGLTGSNPEVSVAKRQIRKQEAIGMVEKELNKLTVKELREKAKENNIAGRWSMSKGELINALEETLQTKHVEEVKEQKSNEERKKVLTDEERKERKIRYLRTVEPGTIVAFKNEETHNSARSAKVINRDVKNGKLKLETKYGAIFIVKFEDIIWVRTGSRWPKGVYAELKGAEQDETK